MKELFRVTSTGVNGVNILFPPKFDFVFYEDRLKLFKKDKEVRTVMYSDIQSIALMKGIGQSVIMFMCKPIGFNINKMNEETYQKIKEIVGK